MADELKPIFEDIALLLARDSEVPLDRTLLYADVQPGVVGLAVFKDMGEHLLYRNYDDFDLEDALADLWDEAPSDKRWVDIEFFVHDGRFDATFVYPDQMGGRRGSDRRDEVLRKYYGDKPVVYPPLDDGMGGWSFTLSDPSR